jgi:hypothetical protein
MDEERGGDREQGKLSGGGFDGLLQVMRSIQSPNLRRRELSQFFDAASPSTLSQFPNYIHRLYILLDPLTSTVLTRSLQRLQRTISSDPNLNQSAGLDEALSQTLEYLYSKRENLILRPGKLEGVKSKMEMQWEDSSPRIEHFTTRRERFRVLRKHWWETHQPPTTFARRVRFVETSERVSGMDDKEEDGEDVFYTAQEEGSSSRVGSVDSWKDEWFVAPETEGEELVPGKSVGGLIRERMKREAKVEAGARERA